MAAESDKLTYTNAYVAPGQAVHNSLTPDLFALEKISKHPYWSRAWTVQEILSARHVLFDLDTFSLTIEELTWIYHIVAHKLNHTHILRLGRLLALYQARKIQPSADDCLLSYKISIVHQPQDRLEKLLQAFQYQKCTDVRDRVYAFANLSELRQRLAFVYEKSPFDVFVDVAVCIGSDLSLSLLSRLALTLELGVDLCGALLSCSVEGEATTMKRSSDVCYALDHSSCPDLGARLSDVSRVLQSRASAILPDCIDQTRLFGLSGKDKHTGIVFGVHSRDPTYRPVCLYVEVDDNQHTFIAFPLEVE